MRDNRDMAPPQTSAAMLWGALRPFIEIEQRIAGRAASGYWTSIAYEFIRFGIKQAWACLFGAAMLALLLATYLWYPRGTWLARRCCRPNRGCDH